MKLDIAVSTFACLGTLLVCGCHNGGAPDAALLPLLIGTWRYSGTEGESRPPGNDLTFTITKNGNYISHARNPEPHIILGTAKMEKGILLITATNIDNANLPVPVVDRQTIIHLDKRELMIVSQRSSLTNRCQKLTP
jgi:hypothetical protein